MLDAVIVGGSAAGLSAALYLGRFRRKVVVFDTQQPANRFSHAAHGFFTRDGVSPAELVAIGKEQLRQYETVQSYNAGVKSIVSEGAHFNVTDTNGVVYSARKIVLATGLKDTLPAIAGIENFFGRSVFHCPYCDGWEIRDKAVAILADGAAALHVGKLLRVLTANLTICPNGATTLNEAEQATLQKYGIWLIETPIEKLEGHDWQLEAIAFADGQKIAVDAAFVRLESVQHSSFAADLGCAMTENGLVEVDEFGRTSVAGVYAAGDMAHRMRQIIMAAMQGASAGIGINTDLVTEDFA